MSILPTDSLIHTRYRVIHPIGQGGFGAVYEAMDTRLGRRVALKQLLHDDDQGKRQFEREARLLANLTHPTLPRVTDHFNDANGQFLVMDYVSGEDLMTMLQKRDTPFPLDQVMQWSKQILDALNYLHNHQPPIIHRDLKPHNLKIQTDGTLMLLDFGLAKGFAGDIAPSTNESSFLAYTKGFASPEQMEGRGTNARSDLYSLGGTLHCLLTRTIPPEALNREIAVLRGGSDPLRSPHELNPQIPIAISHVIIQALALIPDERPANAQVMWTQLVEAYPVEWAREEPKQKSNLVFTKNREVNNRSLDSPAKTVVLPRQTQIAMAETPINPSRTRVITYLRSLQLLQLSLLLVLFALVGIGIWFVKGSIPIAPSTPVSHNEQTPSQTIFSTTPTRLDTIASVIPPIVTVTREAPASSHVIGEANAQQLTQVDRWGKGVIGEVRWAPDQKLLAVASSLGIYMYDAQSRKLVHFIKKTSALSVAFTQDGKIAAAGGGDRVIHVWRTQNGQILRTLKGHTSTIESVTFSPDGTMLASSADDGSVYLWSMPEGQLLRVFEGHTSKAISVAFSPDGQILASGAHDYTLQLWRVADGTLLHKLVGHESGVLSVAFAPNGQIIASGSWDGTIRVWQVSDGKVIQTLRGHTGAVLEVAFAPDGKILASSSWDHTIRLWATADGSHLQTLAEHKAIVLSVAFAPDGQKLLSGSWDGTVRVWSTSNGIQNTIIEGYASGILSAASTHDKQIAATGSYDTMIRLWSLQDGRLLRTMEGHTAPVQSVVFTPDSQTLASAGHDMKIRLWNHRNGQLIRTLDGYGAAVETLAFTPDGATLASGSSDGVVRLWNMTDGVLLRTLEGHSGAVHSVTFSRDGQQLASAGADATVRLWQTNNGESVRVFEGHTSGIQTILFAPDGATLATGSEDESIRLWQITNGTQLRVFSGHTDTISALAFTADGTTLVSGSSDDTIRLWRVGDGILLNTLTGHTNTIRSVLLVDNGTTLIAASDDGTMSLWRVP